MSLCVAGVCLSVCRSVCLEAAPAKVLWPSAWYLVRSPPLQVRSAAQTSRPSDRQTDKQTYRPTDPLKRLYTVDLYSPFKRTGRPTDPLTDRQTDRQPDRQTDRQTDRPHCKQTDRRTDPLNRPTDRPTYPFCAALRTRNDLFYSFVCEVVHMFSPAG